MSHSLEEILRAAGKGCPEQANALWTRYRASGDEAAFTTLLRWYGGGIYRRILFLVEFDHTLAEEAFQSAFLKLHEQRHRSSWATFDAALAWLRVTAANEARMAARCRRRSRTREKKAGLRPAAASDAETEMLRNELLAELAAAFGRLRKDHREVLALLYFEDVTETRAAQVLGCHRETVARRAGQGLERLRAMLASRGVMPAVGGAAVGTILTDAARAASFLPGRATVLTAAIALRGVKGPAMLAGSAGWMKAAAVLLGLTVVGGVTLAAWPQPKPEPTPTPTVAAVPAPRPSATPIESVPDRNLRVFRAEVLPRQLAALKSLVTGDGEVVLRSAEAHDVRLECVYELRHKGEGATRWASALRLSHSTYNPPPGMSRPDRLTWINFDVFDRNEWKPIDLRRPIVLWRNPLTGVETVMKSQALDEAVAAFARLPSDDRTAIEWQGFATRQTEGVRPFAGDWYVRGRPSERYQILLTGVNALEYVDSSGTRKRVPFVELKFDPPGTIEGVPLTIKFGPGTLTPDGRRLTFPGGDWWSREPIPEPGK